MFLTLLLAAMATTTAITPQAQPDPTIASTKTQLLAVKGYVLKAIDQVPDDLLAFKPTPDIRSMGQLFGHIADANFQICSMATDKKPEMQRHREDQDDKGRSQDGARGVLQILRSGIRWADDSHRERDGEVLPAGHDDEAGRTCVQHRARLRALRQPCDLHAPQGPRAAIERTSLEIRPSAARESHETRAVRPPPAAPLTSCACPAPSRNPP